MMKRAILAITLLMGGTALAQETTTPQDDTDMSTPSPAEQSTTPQVTQPTTTTEPTTTEPTTTQPTTTNQPTTTTPQDQPTTTDQTTAPDQPATTDQPSTMSQSTMSSNPGMSMAGGQVVQPGTSNPERDARGVLVRSDPAVAPSGWNGMMSSAAGGPLTDPNTGEAIDPADDNYPACSAKVTDNCVQTYERDRR